LKQHPPELSARAEALYVEGLSLRGVARELGVSPGVVQYWLRRDGVSLRSKSRAMKGRPKSPEHIEKVRQAKQGRALSTSHRCRISEALTGRPKSESFRQHMSLSRRGARNPNYNPDRDKVERARLGRTWWLGYGSWVADVLARDDYRCVLCGRGRPDVELNAHHLDNYHDFEERRTDVNNGATLCLDCHGDFHRKYGRKGTTEAHFEAFRKQAGCR